MNKEPSASSLPWHITNYLKGVAILAVVGNHYVIFYFQSTSIFANGLMTFFYLLAGAGIYISLSRYAVTKKSGAAGYLRFFYKRGSRIYPLYWIAYAVLTVWLFRLGLQSGFDATSFLTALVGAPSNSTGAFWFVTSILECYLAAPLLFLMVRRADIHTSIAAALMAVAILIPLSLYISGVVTGTIALAIISYKRLFLGNLLIFSMGMLIPRVIESYRRPLGSKMLLAVSGLGLAAAVWATDGSHLFAQSELYLAPFLYLAAFVFCLTLIVNAPPLPFRRALGAVGGASYQLYLFHIPFFMTLGTLGVIQLNNYASAGYTLLLFPLLLGVCFLLNWANERLQQSLGSVLFPDWRAERRRRAGAVEINESAA